MVTFHNWLSDLLEISGVEPSKSFSDFLRNLDVDTLYCDHRQCNHKVIESNKKPTEKTDSKHNDAMRKVKSHRRTERIA